jgi:hypothetical protein
MVFSSNLDGFLVLRRGLNAKCTNGRIPRKIEEIRAFCLLCDLHLERVWVLEKGIGIWFSQESLTGCWFGAAISTRMAQCGRILRKREKIRVVRLIGVIRVERFLVLDKAMDIGACGLPVPGFSCMLEARSE